MYAQKKLNELKQQNVKNSVLSKERQFLDESSSVYVKMINELLNSDKFKNDEIKIKIVHKGVGEINQSDVGLATASESFVIVVGFNVKPNNQAKDLAKRDKIDIKFFTVIYELFYPYHQLQIHCPYFLHPVFRQF